ncbi:hypothetical protein DRO55_01180 [Candidatus Bathyarchaeota archaeon]|nr:MAG: hypothetical protein DRO55_01180 [Candidatus Bathyarchaeota archaeon]
MERLISALHLEESDRVPYWETEINRTIIEYVLGRYAGESTLGMDVKDHIELALRIGMDAVGFGIFYSPGRTAKGASEGLIKTWDDIDKLRSEPPDLSKAFIKLDKYIEATKDTGLGVWVYTHGPLDPVYLGMGLRDFSRKLYSDFKFITTLMDLILDVQCEIVQEIVKRDIAFFMVGDDVAYKRGLFIRPDVFRRLYPDRVKRLIKPARDRGIPVLFHSDGKIDDLIPIIVDAGVSALHPIEPYSNDIYKIKEEWGDRLCVVGNVELAGRTPSEIAEDTREHIRRLADGGYILASSHSVTNDVKPPGYEAMLKVLHKYGYYERRP